MFGAMRTMWSRGPDPQTEPEPEPQEDEQGDDSSAVLQLGGENDLQDQLAAMTRQNLAAVQSMTTALGNQHRKLDHMGNNVDLANMDVHNLQTTHYGESAPPKPLRRAPPLPPQAKPVRTAAPPATRTAMAGEGRQARTKTRSV